jgi:hypothetical protein
MRRSILAGLVPALAFAAVSFAGARQAHAGPTIGLDLDLGTAFQTRQNQSAVDFSLGGGGRLGYRFGIPGSIVYLQPEIGGHYMRFGLNSQNVGYDGAGILNGGLKLGLSGIVQPNIFGHLGVGFMTYSSLTGANTYTDTGYLGPAADVGVGLDFRVVPGFLLGAQVAYNSVLIPQSDPSSPVQVYGAAKWVNFGVNATFHFGEPRPRPVYVQPVYYRRY